MNAGTILAKVATKAPALAPKLGRAGLKLKKASPEILFGVGVVAVVGGVVLACRATTKVTDILDEHQQSVEILEQEDLGEDIEIKEKTGIYVKTGLELAKVYLPAVTTVGLGIACFAGSHNIQHQRIAGLAAAYKTVESGLKNYRDRVAEELGVDKEREMYFGAKKEKIEAVEVDEKTGKEKKIKKDEQVVTIDGSSEYARFFDETCSGWSKNQDYNMDRLKIVQSWCNDRLRLMGHMFLNEVYDELGIERTAAGNVVGWIDGGDGDNYIDFGITDYLYNGSFGQDYVSGKASSILLDFNVDGTILDKIS